MTRCYDVNNNNTYISFNKAVQIVLYVLSKDKHVHPEHFMSRFVNFSTLLASSSYFAQLPFAP